MCDMRVCVCGKYACTVCGCICTKRVSGVCGDVWGVHARGVCVCVCAAHCKVRELEKGRFEDKERDRHFTGTGQL